MDEPAACAACGNPIEAGQAWMESERDGQRLRIHAGCLYGEERSGSGSGAGDWEPQDHAAS